MQTAVALQGPSAFCNCVIDRVFTLYKNDSCEVTLLETFGRGTPFGNVRTHFCHGVRTYKRFCTR